MILKFYLAQSQNLSGMDLRMVGETLNFEVYGVKNWNYDLKRIVSNGQTKVVLKLDHISETELKKIKNIRNPYVTDISYNPRSVDQKPEVTFVLNSDKVEAFDYLTEDPPRLVIDFYNQTSQASGQSGSSSQRKVTKNDSAQQDKKDDVSLTSNSTVEFSKGSNQKQTKAKVAGENDLPLPGKLVSEIESQSIPLLSKNQKMERKFHRLEKVQNVRSLKNEST